jgi:hypothetical protein
VILFARAKLYFGIEWSLTAQTPAALLLRDDFGTHEVLLPLGELLDLLPFALVEVFIHLVVRLVAEGLEGHELSSVLDVAELLQRAPVLVVVVFEDERLLCLALLFQWRGTSRRKLLTFSCCFSRAFSL